MNTEFISALEQIEAEKGIAKEVLLEAIEAALISAYRRNFGSAQNVRVEIKRDTGEMHVYAQKEIVAEVTDSRLEATLEEARQTNGNLQVGDILEVEVTPRDFGRIAAQTAKQVVVQRIREAERGIIYDTFSSREGDIVTGQIHRIEHRNVLIDVGKVEGVLTPQEQINGEVYRPGDRLKCYIVEVRKTTKGPQIMVSRTHPGLLKRLFELEVPEIHDGVVEIKAISREAGARSKIAVWSRDENVDPVGACVGPRGMRVQAIVSELRGEKIDIIKWAPDASVFVANALSPAKVISVTTEEEEGKVARVVVPDYQLSLAIGKEGQNARLAARLTGWKIDIKSESQAASSFDAEQEDWDGEYSGDLHEGEEFAEAAPRLADEGGPGDADGEA
ncbi:MAG: transcription termination factor NusA [Firmicutes bacterium]|nr:transcription termination factor NusA [Bacillota bacterium]